MDWIKDHPVEICAMVMGAFIVAGLVYGGIRGWRLYRTARRQLPPVRERAEALQVEVDRLQGIVSSIEARSAESQANVAALQQRLEETKMVLRTALEAYRGLRAPLRYFGR